MSSFLPPLHSSPFPPSRLLLSPPSLVRPRWHRIWEIAAANHFLRCFRTPLGLTTLTSEDFHAAFLECNSVMKIIHLRLLLDPADRKRAPELAEGDEW